MRCDRLVFEFNLGLSVIDQVGQPTQDLTECIVRLGHA